MNKSDTHTSCKVSCISVCRFPLSESVPGFLIPEVMNTGSQGAKQVTSNWSIEKWIREIKQSPKAIEADLRREPLEVVWVELRKIQLERIWVIVVGMTCEAWWEESGIRKFRCRHKVAKTVDDSRGCRTLDKRCWNRTEENNP